MKLHNPLHDEPTVPGLLKSLAIGVAHSVRENKLAALLAAIACVVASYLAVTMQYDERPQYRATILPPIQRAEGEFFRTLEAADRTNDESWRLQYFLVAHSKARAILRIAEGQAPTTDAGRKAHAELIRYYSLVNEQFAIIRTEASIHQDLDYLGAWKKQQQQLEPIRQNWLNWVEP